MGVLAVLLPWVDDGGGTRMGVSQPDGLLTLIVGTLALVLAWRAVPIGWIVSGFLATLLIRDIIKVVEFPEARPGVGLWVAAAGFATAAAMQFFDVVRSRTRQKTDQ